MRTPAWSLLSTPLGPLLAACTPAGIHGVDLPDPAGDPVAAATVRWPGAVRDDRALPTPWRDALVAAAAGRPFTRPPLVLDGTTFQRRVWDALSAIPRGEVRTYGEVAAAIGAPRSVRAVAGACGANPVAVLVPCHRVVAATGLGGYSAGAGLAAKRALLATEGALTDPG